VSKGKNSTARGHFLGIKLNHKKAYIAGMERNMVFRIFEIHNPDFSVTLADVLVHFLLM
jgi:hypothetical protein